METFRQSRGRAGASGLVLFSGLSHEALAFWTSWAAAHVGDPHWSQDDRRVEQVRLGEGGRPRVDASRPDSSNQTPAAPFA